MKRLLVVVGWLCVASCSGDGSEEEVAGVDDALASLRITHGPIVGAVRPDSARIWLRTNGSADVVIEHSADETFANSVKTQPKPTGPGKDFTVKVSLEGIPQNAMRHYRVYLDGKRQGGVRHFKTAPASDSASFSFAVLSDFKEEPAPVLQAVDELKPDLLVFLGDLDHRNPGEAPTADEALKNMRQMHRELLGGATAFGADFQRVVVDRPGRQYPFIHVWDDHDFGINNSDITFEYRHQALSAFDEYFVKASREGEDAPRGVWQLQPYGCADLFVLDLRSERDPNNAPDLVPPDQHSASFHEKTLLGPQQKAWLEQKLLGSTKKWKILLSTVPFNPGCKPYDAWGNFLDERAELVQFIQSHGIGGVVIVSGDIHSGGGIDDGTHSDFPELSVPHANCGGFVDTYKDQPGSWSHGLLSGLDGPGFGYLELSPAELRMSVRGKLGGKKKELVVQ
ncbi:MAG TPA: alkaline phosphatase D family protein [Polyangiaceae bacterium]|nr:alkaline phosphatase D family protein [Polyangiaceae bacterium]